MLALEVLINRLFPDPWMVDVRLVITVPVLLVTLSGWVRWERRRG